MKLEEVVAYSLNRFHEAIASERPWTTAANLSNLTGHLEPLLNNILKNPEQIDPQLIKQAATIYNNAQDHIEAAQPKIENMMMIIEIDMQTADKDTLVNYFEDLMGIRDYYRESGNKKQYKKTMKLAKYIEIKVQEKKQAIQQPVQQQTYTIRPNIEELFSYQAQPAQKSSRLTPEEIRLAREEINLDEVIAALAPFHEQFNREFRVVKKGY